MVNASNAQYDFRGGEWSPLAQGRMDDPRYKTGMNLCLNGYPTEEGAWTRRSGSRHATPTRGGAAGKLLPFNFSEASPYNIEVTAGHLRFLSGTNVVTDNVVAIVSSISAATPAVMSTSTAMTWATGDQIGAVVPTAASRVLSPTLHGRKFTIAMLTTQTFALYDDVTGAPVDGAALGWNASTVATASKFFDLTTPYTAAQVPDVRIVQSERTALLLHGETIPRVLKLVTDPTTGSYGQYTLTPSSFLDGPYLDPYPGSTLSPSATQGLVNVTLGFLAYVATKAYKAGDYVTSATIGYRSLVDANVGNTPAASPTFWTPVTTGAPVGPNGIVATDIGRAIRLYNPTPAAAYVAGTTYNEGDMVSNNSIGYISLQSGNVGNTPATSPTYWSVQSPGWTWGRITALSTNGQILPANASAQIGDMPPVSAAFSGNVSKPAANSALKATIYGNGVNSYYTHLGFVGLQFAAGVAVTTVIITPSSDVGFAQGLPHAQGGPVSVTLNLRGKNGAPSGSADGTLLATAFIAAYNSTAPVTLTSTDPVTTYTNIWVEISVSFYVNLGANCTCYAYISQAQFFNSSGAPGTIAQIQVLGPPLPNTNTITSWRLGAYSDTTGWPTCGCYHEGRFWLAGAIPNRFDSTISNDNGTFNFMPTAYSGVVGDSNAITGTFNSSDINTIFWMMPDLQGIVCGTQAGEWLLQASAANNPLTPASIQAHRVTKYGCANVEPKRTGLTTMFVQKFGRRLHEYLSDIFSGRFFSPNASERAKHLTVSGIAEIAYQEELVPIVWSRLTNGKLAGTTYRRVAMSSSAEPVFNGWHQHEFGSGRLLKSFASGPSPDGNLDSVTMLTVDPETGVYHAEIMEPMFDEDNVLTDAWFLDNAVVPSAITSTTISGAPALRLFGLWHLNGKTVTAMIGGLDCGDFPVTDGYITVPYSSNPLLTPAYLSGLSTAGVDYGDRAVSVDAGNWTIPAVVGFTFKSQGQVLRPNTPETTGARQGPGFGKVRRGQKYAALFHNAQGVSVGTRFDKLEPVQFKDAAGNRLPKDVLFSGMHKDTLADDYSMNGMLAWEVSRPYPATIAAIGEMLATQDE